MFYGPFRRIAAGTRAVAAAAAVAALSSGCGATVGSASNEYPPVRVDGPPATPARLTPGAEVREGTFKLLDTRPLGLDEVRGTARLVQRGHTTVTLSLTGLRPGGRYTAHLHARPCALDNGGPHFKFDPEGPDMPPNEVHLWFTADRKGRATANAHNDREVGDAAPSIVVHPAEAMNNRIACADFT